MSLEQKLEYDFNVFIEMGKQFDFLKVKTKRTDWDYTQGFGVNLFSYKVKVYIPVKRKFPLPNGSLVISASSNSPNEIYSTTFVNLFDLLQKRVVFNELYEDFDKVYKPYLLSQCARVEGGKMASGVKVNPFPPQAELDEGKRIFLEKVSELKSKYAG